MSRKTSNSDESQDERSEDQKEISEIKRIEKVDNMIADGIESHGYVMPNDLKNRILAKASDLYDETRADQASGANFQTIAEGLLMAAADENESTSHSLILKTANSEFSLIVQPGIDNRNHGLVSLQADKRKHDELEGKYLRAKNRVGQILIEGVMHAGVIQKRVTSLQELKLNTDWYVELEF